MLAVMTFNVGLLFAVSSGVLFGEMLLEAVMSEDEWMKKCAN
jgi:hypothetical protein